MRLIAVPFKKKGASKPVSAVYSINGALYGRIYVDDGTRLPGEVTAWVCDIGKWRECKFIPIPKQQEVQW